jgi:FAD-dependent urate hydroxylase
MENLKGIVIGAGMGGMTAALALKQAGYRVEVFEAVKEMRPVGAAISIWSNGVKCLNRLGLSREIEALGGTMERMAYRDAKTGATMTDFSLQPLVERVGQRPLPVARAELQNMLIDAFGREQVRFGARLTRVEDRGDGVTAFFEDGREATGNLLVAADGTHSVVREHVLGAKVERRYAGYVNWNGLVPASDDLCPATTWTTFVGEGKRVSLMPVAGNRFYFFFDVPLPKGTTCEREKIPDELLGHFAAWAEPVRNLIARLNPQTTNRLEIHDIEPFETFVRGRVALLGDAAHSTTPDLGQGGCMAMEDAIVLADVLKANTLGIEDALRRYEALRKGRTAELVLRARKRCDVTHGKDMAATQQWYDELRREDGTSIMDAMARNILGGPLH